jgi:hypothetical protein
MPRAERGQEARRRSVTRPRPVQLKILAMSLPADAWQSITGGTPARRSPRASRGDLVAHDQDNPADLTGQGPAAQAVAGP